MIVPSITRFGEKNKSTGEQAWEDVPLGSHLDGFLLPTPPGKGLYNYSKLLRNQRRKESNPSPWK